MTRGLLATFAHEYELPKDLVIGIVGLAVIGPTLGIINKKKKHQSHLQIIISDTWHQRHTGKQLIELVQQLSMQVVAKELRYAGGNAFRLHPDTAAWCLEEPLTKIHLCSRSELTTLRVAAVSEELSHYSKTNTGIALSPTVNENFVQEFEVTTAE